jgi:hypothetical protein
MLEEEEEGEEEPTEEDWEEEAGKYTETMIICIFPCLICPCPK